MLNSQVKWTEGRKSAEEIVKTTRPPARVFRPRKPHCPAGPPDPISASEISERGGRQRSGSSWRPGPYTALWLRDPRIPESRWRQARTQVSSRQLTGRICLLCPVPPYYYYYYYYYY